MSDKNRSLKWLQQGPECPEMEVLETVLGENCSPSLRKHVDGCPICQTEVATLRDFLEARPAPEEEAALEGVLLQLAQRRENTPLNRSADPRGLAVAGHETDTGAGLLGRLRNLLVPGPGLAWGVVGLLLLAALSVGILLRTRAPALIGPGDPILRGSEIELLFPRGDLTGPIGEFQWQAVAGAARYRLSLLSVDNSEKLAVESPVNGWSPDARFKAELLPGRRLLWKVEAFDSRGLKLSESARVPFRVGVQP